MTQHARLSASKSHRWINCPASIYACKDISDSPGAAALEGTKAHAIVEKMLKNEPYECNDAEMLQHCQYYVDYVLSFPGELRVEQRVSYAHLTSVAVDEKQNEDSFGTADAVVESKEYIDVFDFKYGLSKVNAIENSQMLLYGLGLQTNKKLRLHIIQPRIDWVSTWEPSLEYIEQFVSRVQQAAKEIQSSYKGVQVKFDAGSWCKYCPLRYTCKTYAAYSLYDFDRMEDATLNDEDIAVLLSKAKHLRAFLDGVEHYALMRAQQGFTIPGFELGYGREGNRKWSEDHNVVGVLGEEAYKRELRSPTEIEKKYPKKKYQELWGSLEQMIVRAPAKQVLVPVDPTSDFDDIGE